jgi:hypothetical protein
VTESTRREPITAATQVVSTTAAAGTSACGFTYEYGAGPSTPSDVAAVAMPTTAALPPSRPTTLPIRPTASPSRATAPRSARAVEPRRRRSAMPLTRPATITENVFVVTTAPA